MLYNYIKRAIFIIVEPLIILINETLDSLETLRETLTQVTYDLHTT